jgi:hypothetical protein
MFARIQVSIEGRAPCVEDGEYPLDLQPVPLKFALVIFNVWHVRPSPESPLDLGRNPGVAW